MKSYTKPSFGASPRDNPCKLSCALDACSFIACVSFLSPEQRLVYEL